MSKTVTWRLRKLLVAILLCVTFFAFATACGGSVTGNEDPGQENASVLIVGGAPGEELGKEGDICFDSATRTLYVKNAQHWVETEYLSCEVEENALSVTFKDGTVKRYALASGEENACTEHSSSGEIYEVYPATCIHPGIGVQVCDKCGSAFAVIIPANGNHKVQSDGTCSVCGEKVAFMAEPENPEDPKSPVVVQGVEGSKETKIVIPEKIGGQDVKIASEAFKDNTTIKEVEIQGSVSVGANAFEGCTNLEILTIQEGTESIGEEAFKGCTELDEVTIPETVTSVGANAFEGTGYYEKQDNWTIEEEHKVLYNNGVLLKAVNYTEPTPAGRRNAARSGGGEYQLKENVRVIADGAFVGVENLTRVVLNEKLKTVGANAFGGSELESVTLSAGIDHYEGLKELGESVKFFFRGADGWAYDGVLGTHYFRSDNAPTQEGNYWYEENGAPVVWELTEIQLSGEYKKAFNLNEEFSSEGLKVTAIFNGATVEVETGFDVDSTAVNLLKAGSYDVTVSYLGVSATYSVTVKPFTVTIVYGNGTANGTATVENGGEKNYTLPAAPTAAEGYEFAGWLVDGEVVAREEKTELTVTADVTVTAQWTKLYLVSLGAHENATVSGLVTGYHAKGDTLTFTVTVNAGYKLVSVKNGETELTAQDGTYSVTVGTENITITVTTEKVKVNTSVVDADGVTLEVAQEGGTATITVNGTPKKVGYNFDKWTVTVGDAPTDYAEPLTIDLGNEDVTVTFTAHWTAKTPNVSFNLNGGTHSTEKYEVSELSQDNKYTITITGEPTYEKHRFEKWTATLNDGNVDVMENQIVIGLADDMTVVITANWVEQFTVTYALGEHAAADAAAPAAETVDKDGTVILPEAPNAAEGYEFAGWKVGSDETLKQPKDDITVTADVTVTAQWTKLYLVSLGAHDNATVKDLATGYHAKDDTLTFTVEVEKGYKLVSVMNGTEKLEEQDGSYTVTVGEKDITIIVTTEQVAVTVNYAEEGYGVTANIDRTSDPAKATITIADPSKEGYTFDKWTYQIEGGDSGTYSESLVIELANADVTVTFTAHFNYEEYTLTVAEGTGGNPQIQYKDGENGTYHIGETAHFTITVDEGYTVTKVSVDGTDLTVEDGYYTYTFGAASVTITVTTEKVQETQYTITVKYEGLDAEDVANVAQIVSVDLDPNTETYTKDTKVDLMVDVLQDTRYALNKVEATGCVLNGDAGVYDFTVGTENITITITLDRLYHVTVELSNEATGIANYKLSSEEGYYKSGTEFTLNELSAEAGYTLSVDLLGAVSVSGSVAEGYTFSVGKSDITITITATINTYTLTIGGDTENVTTECDPKNSDGYPEGTYVYNTDVTVTITANPGFTVEVVITGTEDYINEGDEYVITMTADVTITITTEEISNQPTVVTFTPDDFSLSSLTKTKENVKVEFGGKGSPSATWTSEAIKFYVNNAFTISVPEQYLITKIVITISKGSLTSITSNVDTYNSSDGTWEGSNQSVTLTHSSGSQMWITQIEVTYGEVSDDMKVAAAKAAVEKGVLEQTEFFETTTEAIQLPTENGGATLTWTVTDGKGCVSIADNKLSITQLPAQDTEVELTCTISCGEATPAMVTVKIKVDAFIDYGSAEKPLTVEEVLALAEKNCWGSDNYTKNVVYATGVVDATPEDKETYYNSFNLTADDQKIFVGTVSKKDGVTLAQNDKIVIVGYIKNESGTLKFLTKDGTYVTIHSHEAGESTISVDNKGGAKVQTLEGGDLLNASALNGTTFTFKVTPDEGKKVASVTVYGKTISVGDDGNYFFTVYGNAEITVVTAEEGEEPVVSGSFEITQSNVTNFTNTYKQYTWSVTKGENKLGGTMFAYKNNGMQFNVDRSNSTNKAYFVSNVATPSPISKVTITATVDSRKWKLLTSNGPYNLATDATNPTNGTDHEEATISDGTASWTLTGCTDTYFALVQVSTGNASVLTKIEIEYGNNSGGGGTDTSAQDLKTAQDALDGLTIDSTVNEDKTITLPADNEAGVTYEWKLEDGAGVATLTSNSLKITRTSSAATVKLSATATYNGQTTPKKDFTIQVSANSSSGETTQTVWKLVTDVSNLEAGDHIVIVSGTNIAGDFDTNRLKRVSGAIQNDESGELTLPSAGGALVITLEGSADSWYLKFVDTDGKDKYLSLPQTSSNGKLEKKDAIGDAGTWTISFSGKDAIIQSNNGGANCYLRYNNNSSQERFTNYKSSGQQAVRIYVEEEKS